MIPERLQITADLGADSVACAATRVAPDRGDLYGGPHLLAGNLTLAHMRVTGR
jgi:hypothetical protein